MKYFTLATLIGAALAFPALAQQATDHSTHHPAQAKTNASAMADGEVRRIDKEAKKITLRHGPIQSLDMPPMTMVFQVKDTAMLDRVNVGDKVKFNAEKIPGGYAVTEIDPAK